ncbi:hypothetical protein HWV62_19721 [Athelia sp. TMB]|nr:hypothetical protein HWV62_19721 [Athelia sp. TMB]
MHIALRRFFKILCVPTSAAWSNVHALFESIHVRASSTAGAPYLWVRELSALSGSINMFLAPFQNLRSLSIDFIHEGLATQHTYIKLFLDLKALDRLESLQLVSLCRIDVPLIKIVAKCFPENMLIQHINHEMHADDVESYGPEDCPTCQDDDGLYTLVRSNEQMSAHATSDATNGSAKSSLSEKPSKYRREAYALQVQAFINAADEVDIDEEIIDDILDGFDGPIRGLDGDDVDVESEENCNAPAGADTSEQEEEADAEPEGSEEDPDDERDRLADQEEGVVPHLVVYIRFGRTTVNGRSSCIVRTAWTPQEKRGMAHHLKEHEYAIKRNISVAKLLLAFDIHLSPQLCNKHPKTMLYFLKVVLSRELHMREKLPEYNTVEDVVNLIRKSTRVVVLTGAGISVSCGIPDFRSRDGLYASLKETGEYDLDDPQQMFDIEYFRENPADKDKLLRNYTQNIDTLETLAGVTRVLQCHGSFATASCIKCNTRVPGAAIEDDILNQRIAICQTCPIKPPPRPKKKGKKKKNAWGGGTSSEDESRTAFQPGIMKARSPRWVKSVNLLMGFAWMGLQPDITFFGEKLTDSFEKALKEDREKLDLLLVIGTSLNVAPVSDVVGAPIFYYFNEDILMTASTAHVPHSVPQILINKTPVMLLGNADAIVQYLCAELEWELPKPPTPTLSHQSSHHPEPSSASASLKRPSSPSAISKQDPTRVGNSHVWLFEGAEGGQWLQQQPSEKHIIQEADVVDRGNKRPRLQ